MRQELMVDERQYQVRVSRHRDHRLRRIVITCFAPS
jgi:hypothetical protein